MTRYSLIYAVLPVLAMTSVSQAVIITSLNTAFTQNFDGMGGGTTATLPTDWKMSPAGNAGNSYDNVANVTATTAAAVSGLPTAGGRYNWGNGTTTVDRAVGFMTSGGYASPNSIYTQYTNNTGSTITGLNLAFDYERYRINTAAAIVTFGYATLGTDTAYTAASGGDSGAFSTGASAYNFTTGTVVNKTFSISSLNIANNASIYLRWNFNTTGSNSQGIGLDNFSVTAIGATGNNTTITAPATAAFGRVMQGSNPAALSVTLTKTGSDTTTYSTAVTGIATASAGGSIAGGSQSPTVSVDLSSTAAVGAITGTVVIDNLATTSAAALQGSADANDTINLNGSIYAPAAILASGSTYGSVGSGTLVGSNGNYDLLQISPTDTNATKNQGYVDVSVSGTLIAPTIILIDLLTNTLSTDLKIALDAAGLSTITTGGVLATYPGYDLAISFNSSTAPFQFEYDFTQVAGFGSSTNQVIGIAVIPEPTSLAILGLTAVGMLRRRRAV